MFATSVKAFTLGDFGKQIVVYFLVEPWRPPYGGGLLSAIKTIGL